jgi:hypothetical protein
MSEAQYCASWEGNLSGYIFYLGSNIAMDTYCIRSVIMCVSFIVFGSLGCADQSAENGPMRVPRPDVGTPENANVDATVDSNAGSMPANCSPGQTRCATDGMAIELCERSGDSWQRLSCSADEVCAVVDEVTSCVPLEETAPERNPCREANEGCVDSTTFYRCNDQGEFAYSQSCDAGQVCEDGYCIAAPPPAPALDECPEITVVCGEPNSAERCVASAVDGPTTCRVAAGASITCRGVGLVAEGRTVREVVWEGSASIDSLFELSTTRLGEAAGFLAYAGQYMVTASLFDSSFRRSCVESSVVLEVDDTQQGGVRDLMALTLEWSDSEAGQRSGDLDFVLDLLASSVSGYPPRVEYRNANRSRPADQRGPFLSADGGRWTSAGFCSGFGGTVTESLLPCFEEVVAWVMFENEWRSLYVDETLTAPWTTVYAVTVHVAAGAAEEGTIDAELSHRWNEEETIVARRSGLVPFDRWLVGIVEMPTGRFEAVDALNVGLQPAYEALERARQLP